MARGTARLSGRQVRDLDHHISEYAIENNINLSDVVVSINLQSGRLVLTDYGWDDRETHGSSHAEDMPLPKTVEGFSASIRF